MAGESPLSTGWTVYGVASVALPPLFGYMWATDDPSCVETPTHACKTWGESLLGPDWTYKQATGYGYLASILIAVAVVGIAFLSQRSA
jgi:hypothetical protein